MTRRITLLLAGLAAPALAPVATAQAPITGSYLVQLRLDTRAGSAVFLADLTGHLAVLLRGETNGQSGYRELNSTLGARWSGRHATLVFGAEAGLSSDGSFGGILVWPTVRAGRATATMFATVQSPLQGRGAVSFGGESRVLVQGGTRWRVGAYYTRSQAGRRVASYGGGPAVQLLMGRWGFTVDGVAATRRRARELRASLRFVW